jgi:tetratricopeptide (TPR) repeat protein
MATASETGDATVSTAEAPARAPEIPPGTTVGRYVLMERRGAGAMGAVYVAYDSSLDRRVAVKLVHPTRDSEMTPTTGTPEPSIGGGRSGLLLREAQLAAALSHPNVVTVFDVGLFRDQVFVAMEWLGGGSLRDWQQQRPRRLADVIARYAEAAAGLAAAHTAGLVHRDFKPDNVLIGDDDRARVADFGLAIEAGEGEGDARVCGTPAYMAPEQRRGEAVGPAADQYSFCVALYEAIYAVRPGQDTAGAALSPRRPDGASVPPYLRAILKTGLAADPAARHGSMAEIARALRTPRPARWRVIAVTAGLLATASGAALALSSNTAEGPCDSAGDEIRAAWNARSSATLERAFAATGAPFARDAGSTVIRELDDYAGAWVAARRDRCEATLVRHEQSDALFDLQMQCLSRRRAELGALVDLLGRADAAMVRRAPQAAAELGSIAECRDPDLVLRARGRGLTAARADRDQFDRLHGEAQARSELGQLRAGLEQASRARELAERTGDRELQAIARYDEAYDRDRLGDHDAAAQAMVEAYRASEASGDDHLRARCAIKLMEWSAAHQRDPKESDRWQRLASAITERLGDAPDLVAMFKLSAAVSLEATGRHREAVVRSREALALVEKRGDELAVLRALGVRAHILIDGQVEIADALPFAEREVAIATKLVGPLHPLLGMAYSHRAAARLAMQQTREAIEDYQRALAITVEVFGADSERAGDDLFNLGQVLAQANDLPHAEDHTRRALAIYERRLGANDPRTADARINLGTMLGQDGKLDAALAEVARGVRIYASVAQELPGLHVALGEQGKLLVAAGRLAEAVPVLDRALAHEQDVPDPAGLRFALARALWPDTRARTRARALAEAARDAFAQQGQPRQADLAAVIQWLERHRAPP